jgi:excisionase family DNA binding protein
MTDPAPLVRALLDATEADIVPVPRPWLEALLAPAVPSAGLTVPQVAAQLRRGVSTVRTLCANGAIPGAYKLNRRDWLIPAAGLTAFLEQQQMSPNPGPEAPPMPQRRRPVDLGAWRRLPTPPEAA